MKKIFIFIVFIFLIDLSFLHPKIAFASILFQDNFEDQNFNDWNVLSGNWAVKFIQGSYRFGGTLSQPFSSIETQAGNYSWSDYEFSLNLSPINGIDKNVLFRVNSQRMQSGSLNLPVSYGLHITSTTTDLQKFTSQGGQEPVRAFRAPYSLRVRLNGNNIKVFDGSNTVPFIDYTDINNPILNGRIGLLITTGAVFPTEVYFDNIVVKTLDDLTPVVLLPGLGGSWNHEAMILGIAQSQDKWYMTPGVKVYDGLIQTFKNAGYTDSGPNKNLFVFYYDWTKPVAQISDDLKTYIQTTVNPPAGTKINLVGHSLGGLAARTYAQNNSDHPVDKLLTIGSPHKGAPQVYYLWEGGSLEKALSGVQKIGAGLILHLRAPQYPTIAQAAQAVIPSLKNLLPVFNYLKQNGSEKTIAGMNQKNDWLSTLNNSLPSYLLTVLNAFVGHITNSAARWIIVENRDWLSQVLDLWIDGKPISEEKADGDNTVLSESAQLTGAGVTNLSNLDHGELVQSATGIQKIMDILSLTPSSISTISENENYDQALVFQIASPATINVSDTNGNPTGTGDGKLVIVPHAATGNYQVKVVGTATGDYHLYIGQITQNKDLWTTIAGSTANGQTTIFPLNFNPDSLKNPLLDNSSQSLKTTGILLNDLKNSLNQEVSDQLVKRTALAQLNQIIRTVDKQQYEEAISSLYQLRQQLGLWRESGKLTEDLNRFLRNKTQEIIGNLEIIYVASKNGQNVYNPNQLSKEISVADKSLQQAEKQLKGLLALGKSKTDQGNLYSITLEKLNGAKSQTSYQAHILALGAQFLSQEAIRFYK